MLRVVVVCILPPPHQNLHSDSTWGRTDIRMDFCRMCGVVGGVLVLDGHHTTQGQRDHKRRAVVVHNSAAGHHNMKESQT